MNEKQVFQMIYLLLYSDPENTSDLGKNTHRQWEENNNSQRGKKDRNLLTISGIELTTNRIPYPHVYD